MVHRLEILLSRKSGLTWLLYGAIAILWALPFWTHAGQCIVGLHDWGWICYPQQAPAQFIAAFAPWTEDNLGRSALLPTTSPAVLLAPAIALLNVRFALATVLTVSAFAALIGNAALLQYAGVRSRAVQVLAGMIYIASPFFLTKVVSGHTGFIFALAALPFAFLFLLRVRDGDRRVLPYAVLAVAITATQLQVGILLFFCSLFVFRLSLKDLAITWGVVAVTYLPAVFLTISGVSTGALGHPIQLPQWVLSQSIPFRHILDGEFYFANYYSQAAPVICWVLYSGLALLSFVALFLKGGMFRRLAIMLLLVGIIANGSYGILRAVIEPALTHVVFAGIFRELYDLLAFTPIGISLGIGLACSTGRLQLKRGFAPLTAAIGAIALLPWYGGGISHVLPFVNPDRWQSQVRFVSQQAGASRTLWVPAESPIRYSGEHSGADPFAVAFGEHPSTNSYQPHDFYAYVAALADETGRLPNDLAQRTDIGAIVQRPRIVADTTPTGDEPPVHSPVNQSIRETSAMAFAQGQPVCEPDLHSEMVASQLYIRCDSHIDPTPFDTPQAADVRVGWVDRSFVRLASAPMHDPRWPVIVTRSTAIQRWNAKADAENLWFRGTGKLLVDGRSGLTLSSQWRAIVIHSGSHTIQLEGSGIAMVFRSPVTRAVRLAGPAALELPIQARSLRTFGFFVSALPPHRDGWLILREGWAPFWRPILQNGVIGGAPRIVDGYAMGWRVASSAQRSQVILFDALAVPYVLLLLVCWAAWAIMAIVALKTQLDFGKADAGALILVKNSQPLGPSA